MNLRLSERLRVGHGGRDYLFVIKNAAIVELEGPFRASLDALEEALRARPEGLPEAEARELVSGAVAGGGESRPDSAAELIEDLTRLQLFEAADGSPAGAFVALNPVLGGDPSRPVPLQSLVAHVTQDCNLRCSYCYADHGLYGAADRRLMDAATVRGLIDLLVRESGAAADLRFTFFGGEPLMNFPAVREAVAHGRSRAAEAGKRLRFSLTTNGTLFDEERIRFVLENDIAVTASLDGPPEIHDRNRPRAGGGGSYATAIARLRPLLEARAVPARVTLTRRCLEVERIVDHLLAEGFSEVGITPAATLHPELRIRGEDWGRLGDELERAALRFEREALAGRSWGFTNVAALLRQFAEGASRGYPCGAGAGLLAGNASGDLYACHRNVNDPRFALGGARGIDRERQREFLARVHVREKPDCDRCWLRSLCAGGCYHVGAMLGGSIDSAPREMCDHIRRWYRVCLGVYLSLLEERPELLAGLSGEEGAGGPLLAGAIDPHLNPFLD